MKQTAHRSPLAETEPTSVLEAGTRSVARPRRWPLARAVEPTSEPSSETGGIGRRTASFVLASLVAFALAVRLAGVANGLPHRLVGDERAYWTSLARLGDTPLRAEHGAWYAFYPELVPWLVHAFLPATGAETPRAIGEVLAAAMRELLALRLAVVLISVLAIPATYWIARRCMSRAPALFAAALVAASPFHAWYAEQARPHGALVAVIALAIVAALRVLRRPDARAYAIAGIAVAAAGSILHSGFFAFAPVCAAHALAARVKRTWTKHLVLALAFLPALVCVPLFYPFLLRRPLFGQPLVPHAAASSAPALGTVLRAETEVGLDRFSGAGFAKLAHDALDYEPCVFVLGALGVLAWLLRRRHGGSREAWVIAAFALPYAVVFGMFDLTYQRYLLPLLPIAACAAAYLVFDVLRARRALVVAAIVVAECALAIQVARIRAAPDTQARAASWIAEHVAADRRVALSPTIDLPLVRTRMRLAWAQEQDVLLAFPWIAHQVAHPELAERDDARDLLTVSLHDEPAIAALARDPRAFVDGWQADYAVVEVFDAARKRPVLASLCDAVRARGTLVARFSPAADDTGDNTPFLNRDQYREYDEHEPWWWRVCRMRSLGPAIEIYRLTGR